MVQGGTVLEDYNANKRMINAIPFNYAEFILIGHSHVDHIGNICACIPNGFKGPTEPVAPRTDMIFSILPP